MAERGYYPAIVASGSLGSQPAPLTSRGNSSESDDGSRMKLIQEPSPQKFGSSGRPYGLPLNHVGTWLWRRRVAQTRAAKVPSPARPAQPGRGIARGASNPGAVLPFRPLDFVSRLEFRLARVTHGDSALGFLAVEPFWATRRASSGGVSQWVPSLSTLSRWRLAGGSSCSRSTRG